MQLSMPQDPGVSRLSMGQGLCRACPHVQRTLAPHGVTSVAVASASGLIRPRCSASYTVHRKGSVNNTMCPVLRRAMPRICTPPAGSVHTHGHACTCKRVFPALVPVLAAAQLLCAACRAQLHPRPPATAPCTRHAPRAAHTCQLAARPGGSLQVVVQGAVHSVAAAGPRLAIEHSAGRPAAQRALERGAPARG
jgi:hypothetical protein